MANNVTEKIGNVKESEADSLDFENKQPPMPSSITSEGRKVVMDGLNTIRKDLWDSVKDPGRIKKGFRDALPAEFSMSVDNYEKAENTIGGLYQDLYDSLQPSLEDITSRIDSVVAEDSVFKGATRALAEFWKGQEQGGSSQSKEESHDEKVKSMQDDIFSAIGKIQSLQLEQQQASQEQQGQMQAQQQALQIGHHQQTSSLLSRIALSTQKMEAYNFEIGVKLQKKSIELQFRSFLVQGEQYKFQREGHKEITQLLDNITKNTALPDFIKNNNVELIKATTYKNLTEKANHFLFGSGSMFDNLRKNVTDRITNALGPYLQATQSQVAMVTDIMKSDDSMGLGNMLGEMALNHGKEYIIDKLVPHLKERLDKIPILEKIGRKVNLAYQDPRLVLNDFFQSEWFKNNITQDQNAPVNKFFNFFKGIFDFNKNETPIVTASHTDLDAPAHATKRYYVTTTDVIPGYLSRILQQVTSHRLGVEAPLYIYDFASKSFKSVTRKTDESIRGMKAAIRDSAFANTINQGADAIIEKAKAGQLRGLVNASQKEDLVTALTFLSYNNNAALEDKTLNISSLEGYKYLTEGSKDIIRRLRGVYDYVKKEDGSLGRSEEQEDFIRLLSSTRYNASSGIASHTQFLEENAYNIGDEERHEQVRRGILTRVNGNTFKVNSEQFLKDILNETLKSSKTRNGDAENLIRKYEGVSAPEWDKSYLSGGLETKVLFYKIKEEYEKLLRIPEGTSDEERKKIYKTAEDFLSLAVERDAITQEEANAISVRRQVSDRNVKEGITQISSSLGGLKDSAIGRVLSTPIFSYNYKGSQNAKRGPMAQDVQKVYGNSVAPGGTQIDTVNLIGDLMLAIQELSTSQRAIAQSTTSLAETNKTSNPQTTNVVLGVIAKALTDETSWTETSQKPTLHALATERNTKLDVIGEKLDTMNASIGSLAFTFPNIFKGIDFNLLKNINMEMLRGKFEGVTDYAQMKAQLISAGVSEGMANTIVRLTRLRDWMGDTANDAVDWVADKFDGTITDTVKATASTAATWFGNNRRKIWRGIEDGAIAVLETGRRIALTVTDTVLAKIPNTLQALGDKVRRVGRSIQKLVNPARDLYLKDALASGSNIPVIRASMLKMGAYIDSDGNVLTSIDDILKIRPGAHILDRYSAGSDYDIVVHAAELARGLVDVDGREITNALGNVTRIALGLAQKGLGFGLKSLSKLAKGGGQVLEIFKSGFEMLTGGMKSILTPFFDNFIGADARQLRVLAQIRDLIAFDKPEKVINAVYDRDLKEGEIDGKLFLSKVLSDESIKKLSRMDGSDLGFLMGYTKLDPKTQAEIDEIKRLDRKQALIESGVDPDRAEYVTQQEEERRKTLEKGTGKRMSVSERMAKMADKLLETKKLNTEDNVGRNGEYIDRAYGTLPRRHQATAITKDSLTLKSRDDRVKIETGDRVGDRLKDQFGFMFGALIPQSFTRSKEDFEKLREEVKLQRQKEDIENPILPVDYSQTFWLNLKNNQALRLINEVHRKVTRGHIDYQTANELLKDIREEVRPVYSKDAQGNIIRHLPQKEIAETVLLKIEQEEMGLTESERRDYNKRKRGGFLGGLSTIFFGPNPTSVKTVETTEGQQEQTEEQTPKTGFFRSLFGRFSGTKKEIQEKIKSIDTGELKSQVNELIETAKEKGVSGTLSGIGSGILETLSAQQKNLAIRIQNTLQEYYNKTDPSIHIGFNKENKLCAYKQLSSERWLEIQVFSIENLKNFDLKFFIEKVNSELSKHAEKVKEKVEETLPVVQEQVQALGKEIETGARKLKGKVKGKGLKVACEALNNYFKKHDSSIQFQINKGALEVVKNLGNGRFKLFKLGDSKTLANVKLSAIVEKVIRLLQDVPEDTNTVAEKGKGTTAGATAGDLENGVGAGVGASNLEKAGEITNSLIDKARGVGYRGLAFRMQRGIGFLGKIRDAYLGVEGEALPKEKLQELRRFYLLSLNRARNSRFRSVPPPPPELQDDQGVISAYNRVVQSKGMINRSRSWMGVQNQRLLNFAPGMIGKAASFAGGLMSMFGQTGASYIDQGTGSGVSQSMVTSAAEKNHVDIEGNSTAILEKQDRERQALEEKQEQQAQQSREEAQAKLQAQKEAEQDNNLFQKLTEWVGMIAPVAGTLLGAVGGLAGALGGLRKGKLPGKAGKAAKDAGDALSTAADIAGIADAATDIERSKKTPNGSKPSGGIGRKAPKRGLLGRFIGGSIKFPFKVGGKLLGGGYKLTRGFGKRLLVRNLIKRVALGAVIAGGTAALGASGLAATAFGAAALAVFASPILAGAATIGGLVWAGYDVYKYATRNQADDFEKMRFAIYGLPDSPPHNELYHVLREFEAYIVSNTDVSNGGPKINTNSLDIDKIASLFEVEEGDEEHMSHIQGWLEHRFLPGYGALLAILYHANPKLNGSFKLELYSDIEKQDIFNRIAKLDANIYAYDVGPFKGITLPDTSSYVNSQAMSFMVKHKAVSDEILKERARAKEQALLNLETEMQEKMLALELQAQKESVHRRALILKRRDAIQKSYQEKMRLVQEGKVVAGNKYEEASQEVKDNPEAWSALVNAQGGVGFAKSATIEAAKRGENRKDLEREAELRKSLAEKINGYYDNTDVPILERDGVILPYTEALVAHELDKEALADNFYRTRWYWTGVFTNADEVEKIKREKAKIDADEFYVELKKDTLGKLKQREEDQKELDDLVYKRETNDFLDTQMSPIAKDEFIKLQRAQTRVAYSLRKSDAVLKAEAIRNAAIIEADPEKAKERRIQLKVRELKEKDSFLAVMANTEEDYTKRALEHLEREAAVHAAKQNGVQPTNQGVTASVQASLVGGDGVQPAASMGGGTTKPVALGSVSTGPNATGPFATPSFEGVNNVGTQSLGPAKFDGLNPDVKNAFLSMASEYKSLTGKKIGVTTAYRTYQDQKTLYDKNPGNSAKPGSSLHEYGLALDINTADADALDKLGLMKKYGFTRPLSGESWHIEPIGIGFDINRAKKDPAWVTQQVQAGFGRGGGGLGSNPAYKNSYKSVSRSNELNKTIWDSGNTIKVEYADIGKKSEADSPRPQSTQVAQATPTATTKPVVGQVQSTVSNISQTLSTGAMAATGFMATSALGSTEGSDGPVNANIVGLKETNISVDPVTGKMVLSEDYKKKLDTLHKEAGSKSRTSVFSEDELKDQEEAKAIREQAAKHVATQVRSEQKLEQDAKAARQAYEKTAMDIENKRNEALVKEQTLQVNRKEAQLPQREKTTIGTDVTHPAVLPNSVKLATGPTGRVSEEQFRTEMVKETKRIAENSDTMVSLLTQILERAGGKPDPSKSTPAPVDSVVDRKRKTFT